MLICNYNYCSEKSFLKIFSSSERRAMLDMMSELRSGFKILQQELEEERRARRQLESQIQRLLTASIGK